MLLKDGECCPPSWYLPCRGENPHDSLESLSSLISMEEGTLPLKLKSSTCKKKDEMIGSVSLTAKKMLDMKQIFVVLTNPVYPALFSV